MQAPREIFGPLTVVIGDLLNRTFLEELFKKFKFDVILHFAAQARVEPSYADPIATYRTNVEVTINLLEMARRNGIYMVYASSEVIYGSADRYPTAEHYHLRPDSPYAASKAACDLLVQQCGGTVIRSGMGYGERSPPSQVITKMILRCMDDKPLLFPAGPVQHPTRDVNYVRDFTEGVAKVLQKGITKGVFNMGGGREVDVLTLAEKVIATVGRGRIEYSKDFHYRPGEEGRRTWLDNTKAKITFGYEPKYSLEKGLDITYNWLKEGGREHYNW